MKRNYDWKLRTIGNTIFLTDTVRVFELNLTAARIIQLADGTRDESAIIARLLEECSPETLSSAAESEVGAAIRMLTDAGAITRTASP